MRVQMTESEVRQAVVFWLKETQGIVVEPDDLTNEEWSGDEDTAIYTFEWQGRPNGQQGT